MPDQEQRKSPHPNKVINWVCKEINIKITYDNNRKSKAVYNGELILNGEKTGLLMEIIGTGNTMNFYKTEDYYKADDGSAWTMPYKLPSP